jgi:hypothetical protein
MADDVVKSYVTPGSYSTIDGVSMNSGVSVEREDADMSVLSEVRRTIIEDVMIELGYPVISLFITQDQINKMIDFSVRKCANKACPRFISTFYASGCVHVSDYDMEAVSAVYQGDVGSTSGSTSDDLVADGNGNSCDSTFVGCNICEKLCRYRGYSYGLTEGDWYNEMYDMLAWQNAKSQLNSLTLYDYYLDNTAQKLYLDNYSGLITVEYTKAHITLEDLAHDTSWHGWVRDYTLALCKIIEGRIRGKYKVQSAPFEIEADELINEGNNDKQTLEDLLREDIGYWNIMR